MKGNGATFFIGLSHEESKVVPEASYPSCKRKVIAFSCIYLIISFRYMESRDQKCKFWSYFCFLYHVFCIFFFFFFFPAAADLQVCSNMKRNKFIEVVTSVSTEHGFLTEIRVLLRSMLKTCMSVSV